MPKRKRLLPLVTALLLASGGASVWAAAPDHATEDLWHSQCEKGDQAEIEHNYLRAENYFRQALVTAEPFGASSKQMQTSLARLGTILVLRGHFDQAETYFRQSMTMVKNMRGHGESDPDSLVWLDDFGDAYQEMGKKLKDKTIFCLEHCVALRNSIAPGRHSKLASACHELSTLYMKAGKYEEAEKVIKVEIICLQNKYGAKAPTFTPLANLALAQEKEKKYAQAETNLTTAIASMTQAGVAPVFIDVFRKDLSRIQGESHKLTATSPAR